MEREYNPTERARELLGNLEKPPPTQLDDGVPRIMDRLKSFFKKEGADRFCRLLQDTGSLVAGGSVLEALHVSGRVGDIDIYVPVQNAATFLDVFVRDAVDPIVKTSRFMIKENSYKSALYCKSFLQRNGIKKVYNFTLTAIITKNDRQYSGGTVDFDVMIVRNRRTPLQVVNNFDLTFCQAWFDGAHIYASHPEDIINKKGVLQGEYVNLFFQGNKFLKERMIKYQLKGYRIGIDSTHDMTDITDFLRKPFRCDRGDDDVLLPMWSSRVLLSWLLNVRDKIRTHTLNLPPSIKHDNILVVPLVNTYTRNRQQVIEGDQLPKHRYYAKTSNKDDGYDSEDYKENEPLQELMYDIFLASSADLAKHPQSGEADYDRKLAELKTVLFHRAANKLFEITMWPNVYEVQGSGQNKSLGTLLESEFERAELYYEELKKRCVRKGTSFITQEDDVEVYDIHEHPFEAGISKDDLEGYLGQHMSDLDKSQVPCYYKPNPANHDDPMNCKHTISLSEVRYITSKEFYEKYSAPPPQKLGLDQFMSHYDQTLHNSKGLTEGWGMLYHHSVCPFCLQFESRDSGCAYMTHENSKHEASDASPYCNHKLRTEELIRKYKAVSDRGEAAHLEFCAECGRPCVDHSHISTTEPFRLIEAPLITRADGGREHDYVTCTGGGRAELFARILAIRKVYREAGITDPYEERRQAALAADNAPNDATLMAQGAAMFAEEEAQRHWTNAPVPETKEYNDPAYQESSNSNSNANTNISSIPNIQEGGVRKYNRTIRKKKTSSRVTRKN